jgi:predicted DNA-binding transcriptional regulator AlpA
MKLLGVTDLATRWNYTKQGVHQKMKKDITFPKPIAIINTGILVFLESDILEYEVNKKELSDSSYKHWYTHKRWTFNKENI